MKKPSTDSPSYTDRIRSWARTKAHGSSPFSAGSRRSSTLPISNATTLGQSTDTTNVPPFPSTDVNGLARQPSKPTANNVADDKSSDSPPPAPPPEANGQGDLIEHKEPGKKKNVAYRFYSTTKGIILSSWINVLLVFVPIGIIAKAVNLSATIIFAMNAIAIIPLAGLLSHATESVAKRMGDTIGALMNVTFGNAVELIIFMYVFTGRSRQERARSPLKGIIKSIASHIILTYFLAFDLVPIALSKDEIGIVQASLLGSILANLLLILGMCFLIGGLRFREQIYNSTVTQMSACLLSLSVMSLLLPTAFHASFSDTSQDAADVAVLQVSRGTSIILLVVYFLYLLFQLKSHAYMYESTPQHIIDEELAPGPVAAWMDSSSSDSDTSSGSDSDDSRDSNNTASRIKRVMRGGRRRRKSSAGSQQADLPPKSIRTPSYQTTTGSTSPLEAPVDGPSGMIGHRFGAIEMASVDGEKQGSHSNSINEKDIKPKKDRKEKSKKMSRHEKKKAAKAAAREKKLAASTSIEKPTIADPSEPRRVDFAVQDLEAQTGPKKAFTLGGINLRPAIPKTFSHNVFSPVPRTGSPHIPDPLVTGPIPRVRYGIRRTNSLPDRLNLAYQPARAPSAGIAPAGSSQHVAFVDDEDDEENISRTTAIILLLVSTGLVAVCAEFMVASIDEVTTDTSLGRTFVGLIILPIVGNAAEHVTSVTVASKNKMDLAIGVAVGSSIQIALFVTPFIVLLGWIMQKSMTLYFTLFETVSLFVSTFIINFLILDGRSNYLEGALLCAAYMIIAVAAFFYPSTGEQSVLGGNIGAGS